jgi:hypothetical protein
MGQNELVFKTCVHWDRKGSNPIANQLINMWDEALYDNWAVAGNKEWSRDETAPCFKESEDVRDDYFQDIFVSSWHCAGGYQNVRRYNFEDPPNKFYYGRCTRTRFPKNVLTSKQ